MPPTLPPKKKRGRSESLPKAASLSDEPLVGSSIPPVPVPTPPPPPPQATVVSSAPPTSSFFATLAKAIRGSMATLSRQQLPPQAFTASTADRFVHLRERFQRLHQQVDCDELTDDCPPPLTGSPEPLQTYDALRRQRAAIPTGTRAMGPWFGFVQAHGPMLPVLLARLGVAAADPCLGQPLFSTFIGLPDGDRANLLSAVLIKVVEGAQRGAFEAAAEAAQPVETAQLTEAAQPAEGNQEEASAGGDASHDTFHHLHRLATACPSALWLVEKPPPFISASVSFARRADLCEDACPTEADRLLSLLLPMSVTVGSTAGETVDICVPGLGPWLFSALVAVDLPLDPKTERLLSTLLAIICRAIAALRDRAAHQAHEAAVQQALCCLDTLLVVLCRGLKLNNCDMIPL